MAATQVARNPSLSGFDDLVKMPSSPNLSSRPRAASTVSTSAPTSTTTASAFNMRKVGLDENQPPPPPGSSSEVFFRYFLAVELRKAGTQPSEELLDRYVRNHFDSLFKNKNAATSTPTPANTQQDKQQSAPHASTSQVTVAAVARPPAPPAKSAATAVAPQPTAEIKHVASPPELADTAEPPALSGRSFSPIATPPALNSISEEDALGDFCNSLFGEPSSGLLGDAASMGTTGIKFEDDSDQILGFLRDSPFRTTRATEFESATIDPHVVENASMPTNFTAPIGSISPADLIQPQALTFTTPTTHNEGKHEAAPMSEDGMSDDDHDDDQDDDDEGHSRKGHSGSSKPLSAIPMAVGDINHLKPDPEEYKKLSSKEKRQLRNKISARNFRTRRKEYITQLEEQIADRDGIIEGLRQQISQLSMENKGLKDEVKELKAKTIGSQDVAKILEALQKTTMPMVGTSGFGSGRTSPMQEMPLTPSGLVNLSGVQETGSRPSTPSSPRPGLLRANTKKDLSTQQSSFWGGGFSVGGSFMPVC